MTGSGGGIHWRRPMWLILWAGVDSVYAVLYILFYMTVIKTIRMDGIR